MGWGEEGGRGGVGGEEGGEGGLSKEERWVRQKIQKLISGGWRGDYYLELESNTFKYLGSFTVIFFYSQGFIQAILMSGRRY